MINAVALTSCVVFLQKLRSLVENLQAECGVWIDVGDDGSNYASQLGRLNGLQDAARPHKLPTGWTLERASSLKSLLVGLCTSARAHALKQLPGLAKALYAEISGHSGSPVYTRFNKALAASATSSVVSKPSSASQSGPSRSGGGGARGSNFRAIKRAVFEAHCPSLKQAASGDQA